MTSPTPRVAASVDDLRVGMVVALVEPPERRFIGEVAKDGQVYGSWDNGEAARFFPDSGGWFILSEPEPEPVTVPRDVYEQLKLHLERRPKGYEGFADAARALVAAVENGDSHE